jgi:hypothetical protein
MKFAATANTKSSIDACRLSVIAQSSTKLQVGLASRTSPLDINCNKRYVNFYNTRVEIGLDPDNTKIAPVYYENSKVSKFLELNDFIVNQIVAEEMRTCWYEFGEGKLEVFVGDKDKGILAPNDVCFVCSELNFRSDNIKTEKFSGLIPYMKETSLNNENGLSYYSYFNAPSLSKVTWEEYNNDATVIESGASINNLEIDKTNKYLVIFHKDYDILGKSGFYLQLIPANIVNTVCQVQAS